jgi:hypothetical protein
VRNYIKSALRKQGCDSEDASEMYSIISWYYHKELKTDEEKEAFEEKISEDLGISQEEVLTSLWD